MNTVARLLLVTAGYFLFGWLTCGRVLADGTGTVLTDVAGRFYVAEGVVVNEDTETPIIGAEIMVMNKLDSQVTKLTSDANGKFSIVLLPDKLYEIKAIHKNFFSNAAAEIATISRTKIFSLVLPLKEVVVGKAIQIENINFGLNDAKLTTDSYAALDKLHKLLYDNRHIVVEIALHTDSRGNDEYNLMLSQQRAEVIVTYLISKGIEQHRLTARGYGETRLVNDCANGVRCSSEEHQQNRRAEFIVTGFM